MRKCCGTCESWGPEENEQGRECRNPRWKTLVYLRAANEYCSGWGPARPRPRMPEVIVITEEDLKPTQEEELLFKQAEENRRQKDLLAAQVRDALPVRSFEEHGMRFLIHVLPCWDDSNPTTLLGFNLAAAQPQDTRAHWTQYIHRPDRITFLELQEYVRAATAMLIAKVRWEHD